MNLETVTVVVCTLFYLADAVQINYIRVPSAVLNNSGNAATLDCDYSVRPDDAELVVKWLLNEEVVYQWIPPQKPQSLGPLKGRVDLGYKTTGNPRTVYRALRIFNPTTDIAGEYKCYVSTFADEDFSSKNMIVFEPESSMVVFKDKAQSGSVNFTCFAANAYPAPKLILYRDKKDDSLQKKPLQILQWNTSKHPNGRFSGFVVGNSDLNDLRPGSLIHCELRIPGTGYVKRKSLLYYPDEVENNSAGTARLKATALFLRKSIFALYFISACLMIVY